MEGEAHVDSKLEKIRVSNNEQLQDLIDRFHNGPVFAMAFEFEADELWARFLDAVGLTIEKFNEKYYYCLVASLFAIGRIAMKLNSLKKS